MPTPLYILTLRSKVGQALIMMPGVAAFIRNDLGEILLQRRNDNGQWVLPGGAIEPDEEPADAVVREVWEETGLKVIPDTIIGVYGGPTLHGFYPNGDEIQLIAIVFACHTIGGELIPGHDDETSALQYFAPARMPATVMPHHLAYIEQALKDKFTAHFRFG